MNFNREQNETTQLHCRLDVNNSTIRLSRWSLAIIYSIFAEQCQRSWWRPWLRHSQARARLCVYFTRRLQPSKASASVFETVFILSTLEIMFSLSTINLKYFITGTATITSLGSLISFLRWSSVAFFLFYLKLLLRRKWISLAMAYRYALWKLLLLMSMSL